MRIAKLIILIALLSTLSHAQDLSIEKDFERERARLSVVRYSMGEDATSGFDYFVYKSRSRGVRKIRMVWNGGPAMIRTLKISISKTAARFCMWSYWAIESG